MTPEIRVHDTTHNRDTLLRHWGTQGPWLFYVEGRRWIAWRAPTPDECQAFASAEAQPRPKGTLPAIGLSADK